MKLQRTAGFWWPVAQCALGGMVVGLATFVCFRLQSGSTIAALLYLLAVVAVAVGGSFAASAFVSVLAVLCLQYFFLLPRFSLKVADPVDVVAGAVFLVTALAITRLMTARRRMEKMEREQAALLDVTHDIIFVRSLSDDVITYWNRAAEDTYGWTKAEAVGAVPHDLLKTVFPLPVEDIMAEVTRTSRWDGELVHTRRDGTKNVVASRWSLQRDEQGRPEAILETNNDITVRKRAEEELRRQANLLEQTHDAIFIWERPNRITYWNQGAERLYGFSREEAIGRASHELLQTVHPLPIPLFEAALERDGRWTGELTQTARDGRRIIVESRQWLTNEADGRRIVLETNRDITEHKRAEEAWRQAQADLAHVTRVTTMGELATSLAHELNQSLTGIVTNATASLRWLDREPPNRDKATDAIRRIIRDANRASEVITHTRGLLKKGAAEKAPLDVSDVIREILALTQPELTRHRIVLQEFLAADLPSVLGVRVQLQQVALNLIMNGVEAMADLSDRSRELVVRSQRHELEGGPGIVVAVQDAGTGIADEIRDRLFEPFYTTKSHGLGMGLSISRSIIQAHGGRLWATANVGPGTTFQFVLPARTDPGP
jgi:PAS domain S-box-containing protein